MISELIEAQAQWQAEAQPFGYLFGVLLNTAVLTATTVALGRLLCNIWADARP